MIEDIIMNLNKKRSDNYEDWWKILCNLKNIEEKYMYIGKLFSK